MAVSLTESAQARLYTVTAGSVEQDKRKFTAGPEGATLAFPESVVIKLGPLTVMRKHKDAKLWLTSQGRTNTYVFSLLKGRVDVSSPQKRNHSSRAVFVRASFKLMGALAGGKMTVLAEPDYGVVSVESGTVVVSDGGKWNPVKVGTAVKITREEREIQTHLLPPAPVFKPSRKLWLSLGDPVGVGSFEWSQPPGAARYRLSLFRVPGNELLLQRKLSKTQVGPDFRSLPAGTYLLKVRAVDRFGLVGPLSEAFTFNVVGVESHSGSRVDPRGVIHVGYNQQARFSDVDGLLMTYGKAKRWAQATKTVPLYRNERTTVHFRHPDGEEIVSAALEPRGVRADVYVGKKTATWPDEPVDIVVRLIDETGSGSLESIEPTIDVRLGLEELKLDWQKRGYVYRARVTPRTGKGPWVIRATVTDQFGVELGRDFVEVVGSKPKRKSRKRGAVRQKRPEPSKQRTVAAR